MRRNSFLAAVLVTSAAAAVGVACKKSDGTSATRAERAADNSETPVGSSGKAATATPGEELPAPPDFETTSRILLSAPEAEPSDWFAARVSLSGTTAAAGAQGDAGESEDVGAVYIFELSGAKEPIKLTASDGLRGDEFGNSIALSGDTLAVGAFRADRADGAGEELSMMERGDDTGSVYIFERKGGEWREAAKITPPDPDSTRYFGSLVALEGDTLLVGVPLEKVGGIRSAGAVYVYERGKGEASGWKHAGTLSAPEKQAHAEFGEDLAIFGDVAVVGARLEDENGPRAGAAYVYERERGGGWTLSQRLSPDDGKAEAVFGTAVAASARFVAVGAPGYEEDGEAVGAVYVYARGESSGEAWTETARLSLDHAVVGRRLEFGSDVALDGAALVASTLHHEELNSVFAFTLDRDTGEWSRAAELLPESGPGADFGASVDIDGSRVLVGDPGHEQGPVMFLFEASESD